MVALETSEEGAADGKDFFISRAGANRGLP
jgi:hypothetical protein